MAKKQTKEDKAFIEKLESLQFKLPLKPQKERREYFKPKPFSDVGSVSRKKAKKT